ncbi:MAG: DMT family transporter [Caldilineaceae bacterium]
MRFSTLTHRTALLLQACTAILFSTSGFLIKIITIPPLALVGIRGLIASCVIALYIGKPRFTFSWLQICGALALAGAQVFFVLATRQTTAANAIFLQYTAPVYVAFFGIWFLHEKVTRADWATMAVVFLGLGLFLGDNLSVQAGWGMVNALLAGVSFAWYILLLRKQKDASPMDAALLGNLVTALIGLPFALTVRPTGLEWAGLLFLGIFQLGIPFLLMAIAIKQLTAVETILIQTLEPILNPIWVFLVVGEAPSAWALVGGAVVIGAVTVRALVATQATRTERVVVTP